MQKQAEIHALKEWAVAVDALGHGNTVLLLRKGGIREDGKHFSVAHDEVLLYPTYEHQQPHLLREPYSSQVETVSSGWHPSTVPISVWARVTDIFKVDEAAVVDALLPYHIWTDQFAAERFGWKPRHPLFVLLLRAYTLPAIRHIPFSEAYGGCKSWIELAAPIPLAGLTPAVGDQRYARLRGEIKAIVEG
jgi:hypothetical protein